jgi:hypothetical protein
MGKIFNKTILVIVAAVYLLFILLALYAKWNHIAIAQTTITIGLYVKIIFYVYLLLYLVYVLTKASRSRNK